MIARTLLLFLLAAAVRPAANLGCVLDAFDRERQALGAQQTLHFARPATPKARTIQASEGDAPQFKGKTFTQWAKATFNDVIGGDDFSIEPVSVAELTTRFIRDKQGFVTAEARAWATQQCLAYLDTILHDTPKSYFLCVHLYRTFPQEMEYLEKLKGFAFHMVGRMLKRAATAVKAQSEKEPSKTKFAVLNSELVKMNAKISEHYAEMDAHFQGAFRKEFKSMTDFLGRDKELCKLAPHIATVTASVLPQPLSASKIEAIVAAIYGVAGNQSVKLNSSNCQLIRNLLTGYPRIFDESTTSHAFIRLGDLVLGQLNPELAHRSTESNIFFPLCISALVESGASHNVHKLKTCKAALSAFATMRFNMYPNLVFDALEFPEYVAELRDTLRETATVIRTEHTSDFNQFGRVFKQLWTDVLSTPHKLLLHGLASVQVASTPSSLVVPTVLALQDLLLTRGVKADMVFTPSFLQGLNEIMKGTVFSAAAVIDLVETHKTLVIKGLGELGKDAKETESRRKLASKCRLMSDKYAKDVCLIVAEGLHFGRFLHYRYSDALFDLIVDRVEERMATVNAGNSRLDSVVKMVTQGVNNLFVEFEEELTRFKEAKGEVVAAHGDIKALMYLLVAKTVFIDGTGLLPPSAIDSVANYVQAKYEILGAHKIRHFKFRKVMDALQSVVAGQSAQNSEQLLRMKSGRIEDVDSGIKEFGMTSSEKAQLRKHFALVFRNYPMLSESLKMLLTRCQLRNEDFESQLALCSGRNKAVCQQLNPFLLAVPCPAGFMADQRGYCYPSCPDSFVSVDLKFCRKPRAQLVELRGNGFQKDYACSAGFVQEGVLCIPRCPVGWKSVGDLCERPVVPFDYSTEHLLILDA